MLSPSTLQQKENCCPRSATEKKIVVSNKEKNFVSLNKGEIFMSRSMSLSYPQQGENLTGNKAKWE